MDRKGQEESGAPLSLVITILVVAMVALLLFAFIIPKVKQIGDNKYSDATCKASLVATAVRDLPAVCVSKQAELLPLTCTRRFIDVKDTGVLVDGEGPKLSDKYERYTVDCPAGISSSSNCLAHNVLANEMRRCWDTFGNGEMVVFQQGEINTGSFWENLFSEEDKKGKGRACFVCSEVTVETTNDVAQFSDYLKDATFTDGNNQAAFYAHLAGNPRAWCDKDLRSPTCLEGIANEREVKIPLDTLKTQTTYAVTFVRRGMVACLNDVPENARGYLTFTVQAIPAGQIGAQCDVVVA